MMIRFQRETYKETKCHKIQSALQRASLIESLFHHPIIQGSRSIRVVDIIEKSKTENVKEPSAVQCDHAGRGNLNPSVLRGSETGN